MSTKYVFVTGGVVSSVGKGTCAASLGRLFKSKGYSVSVQKLDPYINVDAGMLTPYQHGEIFITDDGAQGDLDLGHYERFVDVNTTKLSDITTGIVYDNVIKRERRGEFNGGTVQVIPHITNEIINIIKSNAEDQNADVAVVEIGGTSGDMEQLPYIEAIRQFKQKMGPENVVNVHLTLIPSVGPWNELKTKPTQHSVIKLREFGIMPDVLICRCKNEMTDEMREKISLFCNVPVEAVIESLDVATVYELPLVYEKHGLADYILRKFGLEEKPANLTKWKKMVEVAKNPKESCRIGVVGKYIENGDAYISIAEACKAGAYELENTAKMVWIDAETLETEDPDLYLNDVDAIIVPSGFGERGAEGKIAAVKYAREKNIPFLGIGYGMQLSAVETARNVAGIEDANSVEINPNTKNPIVHIRPGVTDYDAYGPVMRLGSYPCRLVKDTLLGKIYESQVVYERHRHRYDLNNKYKEILKEAGMNVCGMSADGTIIEAVERPDCDFFIGVSFHPEYKSRPDVPHPIFKAFIKKAFENKK
ncbi:MAG: CTP synthase [Armatimonadetes bacterium]|nr:CTP synthase [Candidatus Hippobium faecium]